MNFFKKILGLNSSDRMKNEDMTSEEFFETEYVKNLIEKYKRKTILLKPHKSENELKWTESKFGGYPNLESFTEYPKCDSCNSSLNFVFQIYKKDFLEFYFPNDATIFQLFRCPNNDCKDSYNEFYDHKMFHYFSKVKCEINNEFIKEKNKLANFEPEVPNCYLKPTEKFDFPNYDDFNEEDFVEMEKKFGEEFYEEFIDKYNAIPNTKLWGYPSFTQSPFYPECNCGKTKDFLFQLSSEDTEDGIESPLYPNNWSSHGIMIGDVGNIYYFVCKDCGEKSIESYWDCF